MEGYRIYKIEIDHFRGYRNKKEFDLTNETDIVMLSGPNGFGKTSFFDAIEWGFTGKLSRYKESNEEKDTTRFINFQPEEENAKVIIEFGNKKDRFILIREVVSNGITDYGTGKSRLTVKDKSGNEFVQGSAKKFINDLLVAEEWREKINFEDVFAQYHLLTQDKLKGFVQGIKATERYKQISQLFGTERFLQYFNKFKKLEDYIDEKHEKLTNNQKEIDSKIQMINGQISATTEINMGSYSSLEDYIQSIIDEYNNNLTIIGLNNLSITFNNNMIDVCKILRTNINKVKDSINKRLYNLYKYYSELQEVEINKENYFNNIENSKKIKKLIPNLTIIKDYIFLEQNLEVYNNFEINKKELMNLISNYRDAKKVTDSYLEGLRKLYQFIALVQNDIKQVMENENLSLAFKVEEVIKKLPNDIINFDMFDKKIRFEIIDGKNYIALSNFKTKIDTKNVLEGTVNDVYFGIVQIVKKELVRAISSIGEIEKKKDNLKGRISLIKDEIDKMSILEKDTKGILNDTLLFIKKQVFINDDKLECPVCSSEFAPSELIKKIEDKIIQDNPIIKEKVKMQKSYETEFNSLKCELERIYNENIKKVLNLFDLKLENFKIYISSLGLDLKSINNNQNQNIESYNDKLTKLEDDNKKVLIKLEQLNIKGNLDEIKNYIDSKKIYCLDIIQKLGYDVDNVDIQEIESENNRVETNIKLYENKLNEFKIDLRFLDESLNSQKIDTNTIIYNFESSLKNINLVEVKVLECDNYLTANKRITELDKLMTKLNEIKIEISDIEKLLLKIEELKNATKTAIENANQKIVNQNEELINIIFGKIYAHPNFRNLKICIDFNKKDNNVLYLQCKNKEDKAVNPAFTFSSAQINAVAISIFLALALQQKCTKLENIFFDDPIQDMDDMNVLSFIDIIRSLISSNKFNKHFVLSTHDEQFYRLMVKKLRFIDTRIFRFCDYNLDGPTFTYYDTLRKHEKIVLDYQEFSNELKKNIGESDE